LTSHKIKTVTWSVNQCHCDYHSDSASDALESCGSSVASSFTSNCETAAPSLSISQSSGTSVVLVYCPKQEPLVQKMCAVQQYFIVIKYILAKTYFCRQKLFLPVRFFHGKKTGFFHLLAKTWQSCVEVVFMSSYCSINSTEGSYYYVTSVSLSQFHQILKFQFDISFTLLYLLHIHSTTMHVLYKQCNISHAFNMY